MMIVLGQPKHSLLFMRRCLTLVVAHGMMMSL